MFQEWRRQSITDMLEYSALTWPDRIALRLDDESLTYRELRVAVDRLERGLYRAGVRRGDHVAYLMGTSTRWVEVLFAALGLGAKLGPRNLTWVSNEITAALERTQTQVLLVDDQHRGQSQVARALDALPGLETSPPGKCGVPQVPSLRTVIVASRNSPAYPFAENLDALADAAADDSWPPPDHRRSRADDDAMLMLTSGSTAVPKAAIHTHETMLVGTADYADALEVGPEDRYLNVAPNYHVSGLLLLLIPLLRGATAQLVSAFDPGEALQTIERERITIFWGFDTHFAMMRAHPSYGNHDLSTVTRTMTASNPAAFDAIHAMGFPHMGSLYGSTEYMGAQACFPYRDRFDFERMKQSHGRGMSGELRIVDPDTGETLPAGELGEICVRGPAMFKGYYKAPEETAACMDDDGFFHSGDYGWLDDRGYLYYRGRYKEMVKSGGENVSALEVEMFLQTEVPGVHRVIVCATPHEKWGEAVTALVEADPGATLSAESVQASCKGRLAGYKIPKRVVFMTPGDWIVTATGKFDRRALRRLAMERLGLTER